MPLNMSEKDELIIARSEWKVVVERSLKESVTYSNVSGVRGVELWLEGGYSMTLGCHL